MKRRRGTLVCLTLRTQRHFSLHVFVAIGVGVTLAPNAATAATAAYWRHEEGPAGSLIPDGPNTVLDSSGNGNHMQTFSSGFDPYTSATYSTNVPTLPLRSGLPNTLSLNFGTGSDQNNTVPSGNEPNDDDYTTTDKPITTVQFNAMTVELAFEMKSVGPGKYQALFGRDGKSLGDAPGEFDSPVPPFKIQVRGDSFPPDTPPGPANQLFVEWIDGDGFAQSDIHFLASHETIETNVWYQIAFTTNATDAQLWVSKGTGAYVLKDSLAGQDFAGADGRILVQDPTPFSIGRGMYNNGVTDWADAYIDEVRVSDTVLAPNQFLFNAPTAGQDADFNNDGVVDGADFLIWQRGLGAAGTNATGDANGDGQVTAADLVVWKNSFGGSPISAVPEPCGLTLAAAAIGLFYRRLLRH